VLSGIIRIDFNIFMCYAGGEKNKTGGIVMHMADALISPAVGAVMAVASADAVGYAAYKAKNVIDERKIPVMGVMGAFTFAAQMINFTIPATGSSGHIGGGILLAATLGPFPALIVITALLVAQCLFFADGGLLALGCNVFNMGVIPCLIGFPLIYKNIVKKGVSKRTITVAAVAAVIISLQLGAFGVVVETSVSGVTRLPFGNFIMLMQPIHLAIGVVEGIVTALILCFVHERQPSLLQDAVGGHKTAQGQRKGFIIAIGVAAVLTAGVVSLFASEYPDGLEWSVAKVAGEEALGENIGEKIQEATAFLPDYNFREDAGPLGTSAAGVIGSAMTLVLAVGTGGVIYAVRRYGARKKNA
jgi:cobalt/nickel transport system permease protein